MSLKLKIRQANNGKVYEIVSSPEDKVSTLESSIQKYTGIEARRQELKMGYPPRKISSKETETLHAAGIRNGETIIVHEIPWDKVLEIEARRRKQQKESSISVDTDYGHIILREMPDDNSCLFRAIERSIDTAQRLREIIIDHVRKDPETYSDVILERSRDEYCTWIGKPNSWGGAIELSIFSAHYKTEIRSVDVGSGRIDRYGQGRYDQCVYLIYSGIHYDALALTPTLDAVPEYDQTIFKISDDYVIKIALTIANKMKELHKYTYTAYFTLRCGECNTGIKGEKEATQHALQTGHTHFTEYVD